MNILVVTHLYQAPVKPRTGQFAHKSLKLLAAAGHRVTVLFMAPSLPIPGTAVGQRHTGEPGGLPRAYEADGVQVLVVSYFPRLSRPLPKLDLALKYCSAMARLKEADLLDQAPDLVFGQMMYPDGDLVLKLANRFKCPAVSLMRGQEAHSMPHESEVMRSRLNRMFCRHDAMLTVSKNLGRLAQTNYRAPQVQPQVIYCAADVTRFHNERPISKPPRRLLTVGALDMEKGVFELMDAMKQLAPKFPDMHLTFAGTGAEHDTLTGLIADYGLEQQVTLAGFVEHDTIDASFNNTDILVFPSHKEGLPHAVIEAVLCERAVVAADVGGISEIAPANSAFRLVRTQDVDDLVAGLTKALETDADELRRDARENAVFTRDRFHPNNHLASLEGLFEGIVDKFKTGAAASVQEQLL